MEETGRSKQFTSKDEVRKIIDDVVGALGINRQNLANKLKVSNRTLHSWITNHKIPWAHYEKLLDLAKVGSSQEVTTNRSVGVGSSKGLENYGTGDLIDELLKRGVKVSLGG